MSQPGSGYSVIDYDSMLADPIRTPAYLKAIAAVVRPGDVVVEVGAGTGYFSVACVRAGARMVYAIERNGVASIAEEILRENGCADRVRFISGDAASAELPERGTVLLFDLSGLLPLNADAIPTIAAARGRLLEPGARIISMRDVIYAAPIVAPPGWTKVEMALGESPHGIRRTAAARLARSHVYREHVGPEALLAPPQTLHTLDYASVTSPDVDTELEWTVESEGTIHGLLLWFETFLAPGVGFSTGPGALFNVYGQPFLPLERAIAARPGDRLASRVRLRFFGQGYLYAWDTTFLPADGSPAGAAMHQSTLGESLVRAEPPARSPLAGAR